MKWDLRLIEYLVKKYKRLSSIFVTLNVNIYIQSMYIITLYTFIFGLRFFSCNVPLFKTIKLSVYANCLSKCMSMGSCALDSLVSDVCVVCVC